jgi:hypothetical protein
MIYISLNPLLYPISRYIKTKQKRNFFLCIKKLLNNWIKILKCIFIDFDSFNDKNINLAKETFEKVYGYGNTKKLKQFKLMIVEINIVLNNTYTIMLENSFTFNGNKKITN